MYSKECKIFNIKHLFYNAILSIYMCICNIMVKKFRDIQIKIAKFNRKGKSRRIKFF